MLVLALETSSLAASCALWRDGVLISEFFCNAGLTHSQTVMPMAEAMLASSRHSLSDVSRFAVSTGPGSFTGLRIGLAAVKGMAMALNKPCAGVSTLEGLAANVRGFHGVTVPVMDARRGQVYTALFERSANADGELNRTEGDSAISVEDLQNRIVNISGPKLLVGDGAHLCFQAFSGMPELFIASPQLLHQRAGSVAEIAATMPEASMVTAGELTPSYLRLPQAERELITQQFSHEKGGQV